MQAQDRERLARRGNVPVVLAVVFSLFIAVTTRFTAPLPTAVTVKAGASPVVQHMNQDAVGWAPPIQRVGLLLPPRVRALEPAIEPLLATLSLEKRLCNRAPPLA